MKYWAPGKGPWPVILRDSGPVGVQLFVESLHRLFPSLPTIVLEGFRLGGEECEHDRSLRSPKA